ncbi:MAG TPA: hypothetical protein VFZ65_17645 [Planctomycetota bacterium]|nr:hypothetical protein [Planctomycetota bacterium]
MQTTGDRIVVTDADDQVRVFDLGGNPVGAPIPVTHVDEYDVLLFAQFFTITDNFQTVKIYDRNGNQLGQPVPIGYGVQHVQATFDRILIIDDNEVRLFDEHGAQVGSTSTTLGEPEAQPVCWQAGSIESFGIGFGDFPAPIDLGGLGAPGCFAYAGLAITYAVVTDGEGFASVGLTLPSAEIHVGARFTTQFYLVDLGANALGIVASGAAQTTVGQGQ